VAEDISGAGFDQLFEQAKAALDAVRAGGGETGDTGDAEPAEPAEPVQGEGTAADGQVKVTVGAGGRVEAITVSPRLLRDGIEAVCEQIVLAVNAGLDDLRTKAQAQQPAGATDPAALAGQLRELQDESMRKMAAYSQALTDALASVRAGT
jgi:DNA-binding protein YbaB